MTGVIEPGQFLLSTGSLIDVNPKGTLIGVPRDRIIRVEKKLYKYKGRRTWHVTTLVTGKDLRLTERNLLKATKLLDEKTLKVGFGQKRRWLSDYGSVYQTRLAWESTSVTRPGLTGLFFVLEPTTWEEEVYWRKRTFQGFKVRNQEGETLNVMEDQIRKCSILLKGKRRR